MRLLLKSFDRNRPALRRAPALCGLACFAAVALCGCHRGQQDPFDQEVDIHDITTDTDNIHSANASTINSIRGIPYNVVPASPHNINTSFATAVPHNVRGADWDYITKSDVYWMLNWIRTALLNGPAPANLPDAIDKAQKELNVAIHDANYDVAVEAMAHLQKGVEHLRAVQVVNAAHPNLMLLPWGAGRESMQRYIDQGHLGFGEKKRSQDLTSSDTSDEQDDTSDTNALSKSTDAALVTAEQQKCIILLLDYETRYHASPEAMMQREWQAAIEKINKLRDRLGLMNRAPNSDGNNTHASTAMPTNKLSDAPAGRGVNNLITIPQIQDNKGPDLNTPIVPAPAAPSSSAPTPFPGRSH